jgi:CVNH domain
VHGGILRARCLRHDRTWGWSELDLNEHLTNDNGIVRITHDRPGNFILSCCNVHVSHGRTLQGCSQDRCGNCGALPTCAYNVFLVPVACKRSVRLSESVALYCIGFTFYNRSSLTKRSTLDASSARAETRFSVSQEELL